MIGQFRQLLHSSPRDSILVRVFEDLCRLAGLSSLVLDRLKHEKSDKQPIETIALDKIDRILRVIKVSLELNRMKITPTDQYASLFESLEVFRRHFNVSEEEKDLRCEGDFRL